MIDDGQNQFINQEQQQNIHPELAPLQEGSVQMNGNDLQYIDENKGWYREGRHGREVSVDEIRVEPITNRPAEQTANKEKEIPTDRGEISYDRHHRWKGSQPRDNTKAI